MSDYPECYCNLDMSCKDHMILEQDRYAALLAAEKQNGLFAIGWAYADHLETCKALHPWHGACDCGYRQVADAIEGEDPAPKKTLHDLLAAETEAQHFRAMLKYASGVLLDYEGDTAALIGLRHELDGVIDGE